MSLVGECLRRVAVPARLQRKDIVGCAKEAVTHNSVPTAEPVHAVRIRIAGVGADDLDVVEHDVARLRHLDLPRAAADHAGNAFNGNVVGVVHDNAMPVRLVHPAVIIGRVLRPVVNQHAAAKHLHMIDLPQVQRPEKDGARREIDVVARVGVDVYMVNAGTVVAQRRRSSDGRGYLRRVGEDVEHLRLREKVVGAREGQLGFTFNIKGQGAAVDLRPDVQAPGLDLHAFGPEAVIRGRHRDMAVLAGRDVDEIDVECRVEHGHGVAIHTHLEMIRKDGVRRRSLRVLSACSSVCTRTRHRKEQKEQEQMTRVHDRLGSKG